MAMRMLVGAYRETALAAALRDKGDAHGRRLHLRRAMAYYFPGNPWVRDARDQLLLLAQQQERAGDRTAALQTWRTLRGALLSLRAINQPMGEVLPRVNERIAALSVAASLASEALRRDGGKASFLARLAAPPDPHPLWTLVGLLGFIVWTGSGYALVFRGLTATGGLKNASFTRWGLAVLAGLGLFALGLGLA